ncbi:MAG: VWA domain-containing protein [Saprospiraceae bacterium]
MFRLENTSSFYLLILIGLVVIVYIYSNKVLQGRIRKLGNENVIKRLMQGDGRHKVKMMIWSASLLLLTIAAVNPQYGLKKEKVKVEKSDIIIALDISNSMNATDISPTRLEKSKRLISQFIESHKGDQLALILFAGNAYLQMPLTSDYAAADLFAKSANTEMAGTQGTAIDEAISLAMRSVKEKNQRALVIISDGEDHEENALDQATKAASDGWNIFTIGVGSAEGGFVPILQQGREEFKMDENGDPVKTKLNKELLQQIAEKGNGNFYLLDRDNETIINEINEQISRLGKRTIEMNSFTQYRSFYQYFLFLALVLLMIEILLPPKSNA